MHYVFGDHRLDTERLELWCGREQVMVEPQVFAVLHCLIENRKRVVSKEELIDKIWGRRYIAEGTLSARISAARRAVGDTGKDQAIIRTVTKRGFRFVADASVEEERETAAEPVPEQLPQQYEGPSLAVLPFTNLSGDPRQEHFANGLTEDIITIVARYRWLRVIARSSSFVYKEPQADVLEIAAELDVRYILRGSIRESSGKVRVVAQLLDGTDGLLVWGERYDREVKDLFELQDEISSTIAGVLVPALSTVERDRSMRTKHPKLDAWEAYQKGLAYYYLPYSESNHAEARRFFDRAIQLDSGFADAHAMVAMMGVYAIGAGQSSYRIPDDEILEEAERAARAAVQCDDDNAMAHVALGHVYELKKNFDAAITECETAVKLNPSLATAYHELGFVLISAERYEDAIPNLDRAISLSPNDPSRWNFYLIKGVALYGIRRFDEAIVCAKEAARLRPPAFWPLLLHAGSLSALGRAQEARCVMLEILRCKPDCNVAFVEKLVKTYDSNHLKRLFKDLMEAGLPE